MTHFSVIIPCFNAAETLPQTLDSLRAQTYQGWEAICIDDGSTDHTRTVIACYAALDERIKLVRNIGKGPSRARNMVLWPPSVKAERLLSARQNRRSPERRAA